MSDKMIKIIAKPWKGGLGRYFFLALEDMFPGQVQWISTRPQTLSDKINFQKDPGAWWNSLRLQIEKEPFTAALFVGHRKEWNLLKSDPRYVLYAFDTIRLFPEEFKGFGRIFLADSGYEDDLMTLIETSRYGGAVPFACYPPIHKPLRTPSKLHDVCFIGNRDKKRTPYIQRLLAENLSFLVVGNYFMKGSMFWKSPFSFRPSVANDVMGEIYAKYKLSLNIHAEVVREGTNMRTFECAAYGIPQVVEYRRGIEKYFEPDREIVYFKNEEEMLEQINLLLADPMQSRAIAKKALTRALGEHTYYHRLVVLLSHLLPKKQFDEALSRTLAHYVKLQ